MLSVLLGRGWYTLPEDHFTHVLGYRTIGQRALKVLCTAELKDGRKMHMRSGKGEWRFAAGEPPDHLFLPTIDKRKATSGWRSKYYDDSKWGLVAVPKKTSLLEGLRLSSCRLSKARARLPVKITKINIKGLSTLFWTLRLTKRCSAHYVLRQMEPTKTILRLHHAEQIAQTAYSDIRDLEVCKTRRLLY